MQTIHRANERGTSNLDWLQSKFSFSFANYYNPQRIQFGALRVFNDDTIAQHTGFDNHPHENMEIITVITSGTLTHKDNTGNTEVLKAGDVQVMSAGTGIVHSEYNNENTPLTLFQIWIFPNKKNILPRYDQKRFDKKEFVNTLCTVVSGNKNEGLFINQDAKISRGIVDRNKKRIYEVQKSKGVFILIIDGSVKIHEIILQKRDSIEITKTEKVEITFLEKSDVLIIEVPI